MTEPMAEITFLYDSPIPLLKCPDSMVEHLQKVLDGEYDPKIQIEGGGQISKICDIGANCGAFTAWARNIWPDADFECYEPSPSIFGLLKENLGHLPQMHLHQLAVGDPTMTKLYRGKNNCGETSLYSALPENNTDYDEVVTIPGDELPLGIDILKIDAEGAERSILERLLMRQLPHLILLEYHSDSERHNLDALLRPNYILIGSHADRPHFGIVKYVRRNTLIRLGSEAA